MTSENVSIPLDIVTLIAEQVQKQFQSHITIYNILEVIILGMGVVEKYKNADKMKLNGETKKNIVLGVVRQLIDRFVEPGMKDTTLEYLDRFGDYGIETVIWLSRNKKLLNIINKAPCYNPLCN